MQKVTHTSYCSYSNFKIMVKTLTHKSLVVYDSINKANPYNLDYARIISY